MSKFSFGFIHIPKTGGTSFVTVIQNSKNIKEIGHSYSFETSNNPGWQWDKSPVYDKSKYDKLFTVVRNPFDVLISYYENSHGSKKDGWGNVNKVHNFNSWEDFIAGYLNPNQEWHFPRMKQSLYSFIYDKDWNLNIDFFFKIENPNEINDFLKKHNRKELPHLNESPLRDRNRKYYILDQVNQLNQIWKQDLNYFDYKYENQ